MDQKIIGKDRMAELIDALRQTTEVIAPVRTNTTTDFRVVQTADEIAWDYGNTRISPVALLMPQSEVLFRYEKRGTSVDLTYELDEQPRTIVGIRPCDVHSLRMMDRVFRGAYDDPFYLARRKHTTLIVLTCNEPGDSCFCSSFDTGPGIDETSGADLALTDLGDHFYVNVLSEHGRTLVLRSEQLFEPAPEADRQAVRALEAEARAAMPRTLDTNGLSQAMSRMFESPYWERIARKCIACGACTYLCPVCYCFDVNDTCEGNTGERVRCSDACTYRSFALLSGGHNPRPSITEGYRQKMYHKFNYAVDRYQEQLCVGCGRCLDACPVNLDIVRVLTEAKHA